MMLVLLKVISERMSRLECFELSIEDTCIRARMGSEALYMVRTSDLMRTEEAKLTRSKGWFDAIRSRCNVLSTEVSFRKACIGFDGPHSESAMVFKFSSKRAISVTGVVAE